MVTARENYYIATIHWGAAQWPIDENNEKNFCCNQKKRECYRQIREHLPIIRSKPCGSRSRVSNSPAGFMFPTAIRVEGCRRSY